MRSPKVISAPQLGAAVHYSVNVLNPDGTVARRIPRKKNLILDSGLDLVASNPWAYLTLYAAAGTGTDPVRRDTGAINLSRSGTTVTADAGFFEAADVGRLIKFDSGEEMYVTAYTDTTHVEVDQSGTIAAGPGTVWYVNRTGLAAETKRTNTYGSNSGDNETTYVGGTFTMKRTFVFAAEAGSVTYNEIGWSPINTSGNNLFGMDIISGGASLSAGQQLQVVVQLSITLSPQNPQVYTNVITGWSQNGQFGIESVPLNDSRVISYVDTTGAPQIQISGKAAFEGDGTKQICLSTDTTALSAITGSNINVTGIIKENEAAKQIYVSGSFYRDFIVSFAVGEGNSAAIRSIVVDNGALRIFRVLLDAAETKDSAHTLSITFRLSWGRVLTN